MKLVMDEKLKHRLVGISVILSLGAIFLPAMMKKSSQRMEHNFSVNVELPPKPQAPNVAVTDKEEMFKTVKIAKAEIPSASPDQNAINADREDFIAAAPIDEDSTLAVAKLKPAPEPLAKPVEIALNEAAKNAVKKQIAVASAQPIKRVKAVKIAAVKVAKAKVASKPVPVKVAKRTVAKRPAVKKDIYALQLASFSKLSNAQALVAKLHSRGYKANYTRIATRSGVTYKVFVGHSPVKNNVVKLKSQLASAMQLNGFVVNTGVS